MCIEALLKEYMQTIAVMLRLSFVCFSNIFQIVYSWFVFIAKSKSRSLKDYLSNQIKKMFVRCSYHQKFADFFR